MDDVRKNKPEGKWAKYLMVSYSIRRASYIIRALAGVYLVYLMYQLFSDAGKSGEKLTVFMIAVAVFMMAAGIYFAVGGAYALMNGIYAENEPAGGPEALVEAVPDDAQEMAEEPGVSEAASDADSDSGNEAEHER